jgi:hypothetical protein
MCVNQRIIQFDVIIYAEIVSYVMFLSKLVLFVSR